MVGDPFFLQQRKLCYINTELMFYVITWSHWSYE